MCIVSMCAQSHSLVILIKLDLFQLFNPGVSSNPLPCGLLFILPLLPLSALLPLYLHLCTLALLPCLAISLF